MLLEADEKGPQIMKITVHKPHKLTDRTMKMLPKYL
ncbi:hypothetical protein, unlikely [Trypanosoma brucei brucei TREU927]|uniref:Uncharacterized protein n=1 Tax=Trypanosoma brucei brucei (strain 927/4 GUTat10.1) TaxID=185431 RepID=Q38F62_TRYB2|nr:hypothetical protein, unlikely [Trypanosoma brucei brucei TREU927]EAN76558.1 hypothetical protein, unlikely [Trypanosoma brucei brucei TREU927]